MMSLLKVFCYAKIFSQKPGAGVAQSVEQRTENPRVGGSIPSPGTRNIFKTLLFSVKISN